MDGVRYVEAEFPLAAIERGSLWAAYSPFVKLLSQQAISSACRKLVLTSLVESIIKFEGKA